MKQEQGNNSLITAKWNNLPGVNVSAIDTELDGWKAGERLKGAKGAYKYLCKINCVLLGGRGSRGGRGGKMTITILH